MECWRHKLWIATASDGLDPTIDTIAQLWRINPSTGEVEWLSVWSAMAGVCGGNGSQTDPEAYYRCGTRMKGGVGGEMTRINAAR